MSAAPLLQLDIEHVETLRKIPGVTVSTSAGHGTARVTATSDVVPFVEQITGGPGTVATRHTSTPTSHGLVLPEKFHPWERIGAELLASGQKQALIWSTGIGKTCTALAAATTPALIVTRAMGRDVWPRDAAWVRPTEHVSIILGTEPERVKRSKAQLYSIERANKWLDDLRRRGAVTSAVGSLAEVTAAPWVVIGWETLSAHLQELAGVRWETIIWDESHMAAGRGAQRTDAAHRLSRMGKRNWLLTATPVRNYLQDLWAQLRLISSTQWGRTSWRFVHRYCDAQTTEWGGLDTKGVSNSDELAYRISQVADVRSRESVAQYMPPKSREIIRMEVRHQDEVKIPATFNKRGIEAAIAWSAATKLGAIIDDVAGFLVCREKVVLVGNRRAWVPEAVKRVTSAVKRHRPTAERLWIRGVSGEVPVPERQAIAREFMEVDGPAILVATIDSIDESIDLQNTDWACVASVPYTPKQAMQLEGRFSRLGGRPVVIRYYVALGTLDEQVEYNLLRKLETIDKLGLATAQVGKETKSEREALDALSDWLRKRATAIDGASIDWDD